MKYICAVLSLALIALVAADSGYYVPKAFYVIDENGQPSQLVYLNEPIPNRFRRGAQFGGSSSSASSSSSSSHSNVPYFAPGLGNPFFGQPMFGNQGYYPQQRPGGQGSFSGVSTQTSGSTLHSRFGEDEPVVTGNTQTITSNNGGYIATSSHLRPDGKVEYNVQKGKF